MILLEENQNYGFITEHPRLSLPGRDLPMTSVHQQRQQPFSALIFVVIVHADTPQSTSVGIEKT